MTRRRAAMKVAAAVSVAAAGMAGCTTTRVSNPPRTATEQLLISAAADKAAAKLKLDLPPGTKIFVDASNFEGYDSKYAVGTITNDLLRQGARVTTDKAKADIIVAIRSGALSIDDRKTLFGLPAIGIPVPLAGTFTTPEIALYEKDEQRGIAKFALTGYGSEDGGFRASSGPVYGFSHEKHWIVLVLVTWSRNDILPKDPNE